MKPAQPSRCTVYYTIFKWCILIFSYGFLIYKICRIDNYEELTSAFRNLNSSHFRWLLYVLLLLPLNWLLEALKWQFLCRSFEKISLQTAIKSVLGGLTPGFISPNRIGEIVGRPLFLQHENRASGALMTVISGFSQTITIIACGIPAAVFFFFHAAPATHHEYKFYIYFCGFWLLFFLLIYVQLPNIAKWLSSKKITKSIHKELLLVSELSLMQLLTALGYSLVRYAVFCLQFYFLLFFCQVYITPLQALVAITLNYLFVTITPTISFSEAAVRASSAVFFIGFFSDNTLGIASAGILLWLINFITPMLVGSVFFAKTKV